MASSTNICMSICFKFRLLIIFLGALLGELCKDMYIKLCHVIPLCIGLKIIPQLCKIILLDLQTRSMHDSFAKPTCVTPLITWKSWLVSFQT